jgi:hypothetical protein
VPFVEIIFLDSFKIFLEHVRFLFVLEPQRCGREIQHKAIRKIAFNRKKGKKEEHRNAKTQKSKTNPIFETTGFPPARE